MKRSDHDTFRQCEVDAIDASRTIGSTRPRNAAWTAFAVQVPRFSDDQFGNDELAPCNPEITLLCRLVDEEQMELAEGYEIPNCLSSLLNQTRRLIGMQ